MHSLLGKASSSRVMTQQAQHNAGRLPPVLIPPQIRQQRQTQSNARREWHLCSCSRSTVTRPGSAHSMLHTKQ